VPDYQRRSGGGTIVDGLVTDEALLVALQVLPTVSIFGTQLVSARVHNQANEASTKAAELERQIQEVLTRDRAGADRELGELAGEHERTLMRRPWGWDATTLNVIVLALVAVLVVVIVQLAEPEPAGNWLRRGLMDLDPTLWAVVGIGLVQLAIVVIGVVDIRRIRRWMRARREVNFWGKTATIALLISDEPYIGRRFRTRTDRRKRPPVRVRQTFERELAHALELAEECIQEQQDKAWPLRLRARVRLTAARRGNDGTTQAGAAVSDLDALQQLRKRVRPEELLLQSEAYDVLRDVRRALAAVNKALRVDRQDTRLLLRRGELRERLAETYGPEEEAKRQTAMQDALRDYQTAAKYDRQSVEPFLARAWAHLELVKDPEEAESDAEDALKLAPGHPEATELWRRAVLEQVRRQIDQGQGAEGLERLKEAWRRRPMPRQAGVALQLVLPHPVLVPWSDPAAPSFANRLRLLGKVATIAWTSMWWWRAQERAMARQFGEYLKSRRETLGLSQAALANAVSLNPRAIDEYEQGKRLPRPPTVAELALVLNVPATTLLVMSGHLLPSSPAEAAPVDTPEPPAEATDDVPAAAEAVPSADSAIAANAPDDFLDDLFRV
jgi:transcriptional regulator with XRE-family HTH domain